MSESQPEKPAGTPDPSLTDKDPPAQRQTDANGRRWAKIGFGAAIGSAAIAAALLYANRPSRNDRK